MSAGLWVTQSYLDTHRDGVQNVINAVVEALHREKSDRDYAESEITKHLGVKDKGELDFTYGLLHQRNSCCRANAGSRANQG